MSVAQGTVHGNDWLGPAFTLGQEMVCWADMMEKELATKRSKYDKRLNDFLMMKSSQTTIQIPQGGATDTFPATRQAQSEPRDYACRDYDTMKVVIFPKRNKKAAIFCGNWRELGVNGFFFELRMPNVIIRG